MKSKTSTFFAAALCILMLAESVHGAVIVDRPWRYTTQKPADGWQREGFDDSEWSQGYGGFGERSTPGSRIATEWRTKNIWLRQTVELEKLPKRPALYIYHDEDAEVFINGAQVATFKGYITKYGVAPLDEKGAKALRAGKNLVAVHCRQTTGGQAIDVHVIDADNSRAQTAGVPLQVRPRHQVGRGGDAGERVARISEAKPGSQRRGGETGLDEP